MRKTEIYLGVSLACGGLIAGCGSEAEQNTTPKTDIVTSAETIEDPSRPTIITNIPALRKLSDGVMTVARVENMKLPQPIEVFRVTGNIACGADKTFIERPLIIAGALQSEQPYSSIKNPDTKEEVVTLIDELSIPTKIPNDPETAIWVDDVAISTFTECEIQKVDITSRELLDPEDVRTALINDLISVEPVPETSSSPLPETNDAVPTPSVETDHSDERSWFGEHRLITSVLMIVGILALAGGIWAIQNVRKTTHRSQEERERLDQESQAKRARDKAFQEAQNAQEASALSNELGKRRSEAKTIIIPPKDPEV